MLTTLNSLLFANGLSVLAGIDGHSELIDIFQVSGAGMSCPAVATNKISCSKPGT